jgi:hypothetical protein
MEDGPPRIFKLEPIPGAPGGTGVDVALPIRIRASWPNGELLSPSLREPSHDETAPASR